jgi:hypothetical protein
MLVVETIAKIGRAYFSLGKPIKETFLSQPHPSHYQSVHRLRH